MIIRSVERSDFAAWLPLWEGYNAFYGRAGATALPRSITDTTWERFFDAAEPVHALVAAADTGAAADPDTDTDADPEDGGALLGLVHFLYHRSTTSLGPVCYLQDLFTTPAARGTGVGRALIAAVGERAAADGASRVYWQTHETNTAARLLYDKVATHAGFLVYSQALT